MKLKKVLLLVLIILSLTSCVNEAPSNNQDDLLEAMTYAEFMAKEADEAVIIEGFIAAKQSWWDNKVTMYLVTETPGEGYFIYNFPCTEDENTNVYKIGEYIHIEGTKTIYAGEHEIMGENITKSCLVDKEELVMPPTPIELSDKLSSLTEYRNSFFTVTLEVVEYETTDQDVSVSDSGAWGYKGAEVNNDLYFRLSDGSNNLDCCVEYYLTDNKTDVYEKTQLLEVGHIVTITGYLYWYNGANPHVVSLTINNDDELAVEILSGVADKLSLPIEATENLSLETSVNGVDIVWTSDNVDVITSEGVVNRPGNHKDDCLVTLTADLSYKGKTLVKEFEVTVIKKDLDIYSVNKLDNYYYQIDSTAAEEYPYYDGFTYAGLINADGTVHNEFTENITTGKSINVKMFGAKADDSTYDNTTAFNNAIAACSVGDEVYVPAGKYYFSSAISTTPYYAHIQLKEGVNIRGEGSDKSILVSNYLNGEYVDSKYGKKTATLICNYANCTISNLGFTANTDDSCLPEDPTATTVNNPEGNAHAPAFGIVVYNTSFLNLVKNVYIHDVYVEYFQYDGIRLYCTRDCLIDNATIAKSTDVGGGGAGYGIELRGSGHEQFDSIGGNLDSCYNVIQNCTIIGPYIRHGIILSYMTHNNLFYKNVITETADDAYDVHGQDEALNVFVENYAYKSRAAGLGLGNTGSSHDESGFGNVIINNYFEECRYGITVTRGTPYTQLIGNTIKNCTTNFKIEDAPNTYQENNIEQ